MRWHNCACRFHGAHSIDSYLSYVVLLSQSKDSLSVKVCENDAYIIASTGEKKPWPHTHTALITKSQLLRSVFVLICSNFSPFLTIENSLVNEMFTPKATTQIVSCLLSESIFDVIEWFCRKIFSIIGHGRNESKFN